ncbi:polymorphic toxin-type HINT domain-containing protein [Nonomuraea sp. NPDC050310]|uniref:polymorphic toxin-type HINT domain-containing protein n=1 Tax=Nonomuraea sp. NPDC050310 TaxID=3154935 RepID=UPI0033DA9184
MKSKDKVEQTRRAYDDAVRACARYKQSFVAETTLLLADGAAKPIEDIELDDEVLATGPQSGKTESKPVVALISGPGSKDLVHLTVKANGGVEEIIATDEHPFWVRSPAAWRAARELRVGDDLRSGVNKGVEIIAIRKERVHGQRVYNLPVADTHTYYVAVAGTNVLVHHVTVVKPPRNKVPLGDKYHGEVDQSNGEGGQASREMHVYYKGKEIGATGPIG